MALQVNRVLESHRARRLPSIFDVVELPARLESMRDDTEAASSVEGPRAGVLRKRVEPKSAGGMLFDPI